MQMSMSYSNELYVDIPRGSNGGTFELGFANNSPSAWLNNSTRFTVTVRDVAHVLSTAISSDAGDDSTYHTGDTIEVTVTFNEEVDVTGTPRLGLRIGSNTRSASCAADPDNAANLICTYAVVAADLAKNGISIAADALSLPAGASIKRQDEDADAVLGHGALTAQSDHRVNDAPVIVWNGVSITSTAPGDDSKYDTGDVIEVTVTFDEAVDVHTTPGTPRLALTIGSNTRFAPYAATYSTARALVFAYTVMTDDNDQDGISIAADALDPNRGDIRRQGDAGVSARLGHSALPTQPAHRVNPAPAILDDGVAVTSTPRTRTDTYGAGETERTVRVAVLDDAHDEGEETLVVRLTAAAGARIADGEATGTIENADPLPGAWLARMGRRRRPALRSGGAGARAGAAGGTLLGRGRPRRRPAVGAARRRLPGAGGGAAAPRCAPRRRAQLRPGRARRSRRGHPLRRRDAGRRRRAHLAPGHPPAPGARPRRQPGGHPRRARLGRRRAHPRPHRHLELVVLMVCGITE